MDTSALGAGEVMIIIAFKNLFR